MYLDLDTECFKAMDASLAGADMARAAFCGVVVLCFVGWSDWSQQPCARRIALVHSTQTPQAALSPFLLKPGPSRGLPPCPWRAQVFMAEKPSLVNNAQMASIAGHAMWSAVQLRMQAQAAAGVTWPIEATGPNLITRVFRVSQRLRGLDCPQLSAALESVAWWLSLWLGGSPMKAPAFRLLLSSSMQDEFGIGSSADLPGSYRSRGNTTARVYGPGQWFTPCAWDDWTCQVSVRRAGLRCSSRGEYGPAHR